MAIDMFADALDRIDTMVGTGPDMVTKVKFGGGGRGQFASVALPDGDVLVGRGSSKYAALINLLDTVRANGGDDGRFLLPLRPTVESTIEAIRVVFPGLDIDEEDDNRRPGPVWVDVSGQMTLLRIVPCVGECMAGQSDICECRCDGANHGIANGDFLAMFRQMPTPAQVAAAQAAMRPTMIGPKQCLCGCGGTTQRRFVPGHDARYHAAQKRAAKEAAQA